ncbi:hypothetical protein DSM21852_42750 (plasmid) [Methylocystis bryophila]|nr:hypothetical protein DSM21852_42750 [Methylocystis bryophila]
MNTNKESHRKKPSSWGRGLAAGGAVLVSSIGSAALANPTLTTLHAFCSSTNSPPGTVPGCADGSYPDGKLHHDRFGNIYGTATLGGLASGVNASSGNGLVFKISPQGTYSVVYSFQGGTDGSVPLGGVVGDPAGNLYGVAGEGGTNGGELGTQGNGVVYKISSNGTQSVLYSFCQNQNLPFPGYPNCSDGSYPYAKLHIDQNGNLYGTTIFGGLETGVGGPPPDSTSAQTGFGNGVVFELSPTGRGNYSYRLLYQFTGITNVDGANPWAGLIADAAGNLYGTTYGGGAPGISNVGNGVVYQLSPGPWGHYNYKVLYQFTGYADGSSPVAPLRFDAYGNLYGATTGGGDAYGLTGNGVVYKLSPQGRESVLHTFTNGSDGGSPSAGLLEDCNGDLYGATNSGGNVSGICATANAAGGCGVVYKISRSGAYSVLYTFTGGNDGGSPNAQLIADSSGNLYGVAGLGGNPGGPEGSAGNGTVYKLSGTGFNASCY